MRDHSSAYELSQVKNDPKSYLLRSELLAAISIFYRQLHDMIWNPRVEKYKPILRYKEGFLTVGYPLSLLRLFFFFIFFFFFFFANS